jgi:hypothetical protein
MHARFCNVVWGYRVPVRYLVLTYRKGAPEPDPLPAKLFVPGRAHVHACKGTNEKEFSIFTIIKIKILSH